MNWLSCIAQDTVKSRYQTAPAGKYTGLTQVFMEIVSLILATSTILNLSLIVNIITTMYLFSLQIRMEGPRGLFQGLTPALLRAFPANAACFLGVELSLRLFNWIAPNW